MEHLYHTPPPKAQGSFRMSRHRVVVRARLQQSNVSRAHMEVAHTHTLWLSLLAQDLHKTCTRASWAKFQHEGGRRHEVPVLAEELVTIDG